MMGDKNELVNAYYYGRILFFFQGVYPFMLYYLSEHHKTYFCYNALQ